MTAAASLASQPAARGRVFPGVLAGVVLDGQAARPARMLDLAFLAGNVGGLSGAPCAGYFTSLISPTPGTTGAQVIGSGA
jgi:hypothetical protein